MGGRRATMPRRAIKAATRDAAVYLNIELIGDSLLKMKSKHGLINLPVSITATN
jgi:hypothetical protein